MYVWERPHWTDFRWDNNILVDKLAQTTRLQGRLLGRVEGLGFRLQADAELQVLTADVLKTSEIEGERLDPAQVRSSIARRLGLEAAGIPIADRVEGIVQVVMDATKRHDAPLTEQRLFDWHAAMFPTGRSGMHQIIVGGYRDDRDGPMQVISGPIGKPTVHYEAPPAPRVATEMALFLDWFNAKPAVDPVLKAAIAHLWFVTIHPFEDGNGRLARAIADMGLARSENSDQRFYSMSTAIKQQHAQYYAVLQDTQHGDGDITAWLSWFLDCLQIAIASADQTMSGAMTKAKFFEGVSDHLNERQRKFLNLLLDHFEGNLTSSKWAKIAKCSQDTASRDIDELVKAGILKREGRGRSTHYVLASKT